MLGPPLCHPCMEIYGSSTVPTRLQISGAHVDMWLRTWVYSWHTRISNQQNEHDAFSRTTQNSVPPPSPGRDFRDLSLEIFNIIRSDSVRSFMVTFSIIRSVSVRSIMTLFFKIVKESTVGSLLPCYSHNIVEFSKWRIPRLLKHFGARLLPSWVLRFFFIIYTKC
jgi:hypothetical protein